MQRTLKTSYLFASSAGLPPYLPGCRKRMQMWHRSQKTSYLFAPSSSLPSWPPGAPGPASPSPIEPPPLPGPPLPLCSSPSRAATVLTAVSRGTQRPWRSAGTEWVSWSGRSPHSAELLSGAWTECSEFWTARLCTLCCFCCRASPVWGSCWGGGCTPQDQGRTRPAGRGWGRSRSRESAPGEWTHSTRCSRRSPRMSHAPTGWGEAQTLVLKCKNNDDTMMDMISEAKQQWYNDGHAARGKTMIQWCCQKQNNNDTMIDGHAARGKTTMIQWWTRCQRQNNDDTNYNDGHAVRGKTTMMGIL